MYFFTSQTPPKKINKIIPRVANSSYRLFSFFFFACLDFAHCKTFFFPVFSHSPQTSVTLFAFVGQDVDVIQFEIVAGVLHKFCFVSLNIIP